MATINFAHVQYGRTDAEPSCIKAFQEALIRRGYSIPAGATGFYGDQTKNACAAFQRAQG
jgi:peptidoglycan hydrolase-like protein with peptidoglycan-binding domain